MRQFNMNPEGDTFRVHSMPPPPEV